MEDGAGRKPTDVELKDPPTEPGGVGNSYRNSRDTICIIHSYQPSAMMNFSIGASHLKAAIFVSVFAFVFVACSGSDRGNSSKPNNGEKRPGSVIGVIAPPTTSFDVRFDWDRGIAGRPHGSFAWGQQSGIRRRDARDTTIRGSFLIESDVSMTPTLALAGVSLGCDWMWFSGGVRPDASCSTGGATEDDDLFGAIDAALRSGTITEQSADRQIAGLEATCYTYSGESDGAICVDGAGTPLYFIGFSPPRGRRETIVATSVSRNVPALSIPQPLPPDVDLRSAPEINISELQLPE